VSAIGCKHCHYITFQLGVAYAEKQSEAKDTGFDHPLHCSSSSTGPNRINLDIMVW
jgi:hypothetical protein